MHLPRYLSSLEPSPQHCHSRTEDGAAFYCQTSTRSNFNTCEQDSIFVICFTPVTCTVFSAWFCYLFITLKTAPNPHHFLTVLAKFLQTLIATGGFQSLTRFSWSLLCPVTPGGSHSAVGTACFEKGSTKCRQGKREKCKIWNCCTFCL